MPDPWCEQEEVPDKDGCLKLSTNSLCEIGWRPLLLTGFLVDMLRRKFHDLTQIEDDDLARYVWSDDERTGILIETVHRWRDDLVEKRPAVLVKRNAMKNLRIVIGDLSGQDGRGTQHTQLWVGSHTLFCIHGTGASTEILATEVQRHFTRFSPAIRDELGLLQFAVTEAGAISEVEEATENFVVPITIGWAYDETWKLVPEALPIKRISLSLLLGCDQHEAWVARTNPTTRTLPPGTDAIRRGIKRPGK